MKKFGWLRGLVLCSILFLSPGLGAEAKEEAVIHQGVYLDEVDVSGKTIEEAGKALEDFTKTLGRETLTLQIEENKVEVQLADLGLQCANPQIVEDALGLGRSGNIIKRFKEQKQLEKSSKVLELEWMVDAEATAQFVEEKCIEFDVAAENAGLVRENGEFTVVEGKAGVKLDVEGAKEAIAKFVEQDWQQESAAVVLPTEVAEARGTAEELAKVKDELGTFTTSYATSNSNRSQNVANGAALINGIVLYPGETFSTYQVVAPFTVANGYAMAGSYANGRLVDSMGGGICQVSTTLYNAVLLAELEIVERDNHSMTVSYVDPAADAVIAGTVKDFKFKNNTDTPIYIEGITENKRVTFTIYGEETRPANREVKYTSVTLSTTEPGFRIVADPGQVIGIFHTESAHRGVVAELYKHVYEDGVEVSKELVNKSKYKASPRTLTVGVAGDPALSAEIQAAVATQDEAAVRAVVASCLARMQ